MGNISFNAIPVGIRTPGTYLEVDPSRALNGLPVERHRMLVMGHKVAAGSGAVNTVYRIASADAAVDYFGDGSLAQQLCAAVRRANDNVDLYAVALGEGSVAATGTLAFTGPATAAGTLWVYVGGSAVRVAVASGDTATDVAARLVTALNKDKANGVTATSSSGTVTVTAKHRSELGNSIDLRHSYFDGERLPAGLGLTITAMSGGSGNPDVQPAITAIGDAAFHTVVCPWFDAVNLGKIEALMSTRFGPMVQKEGLAYTGASGTVGTLTTLGTSRNSPHLVVVGSGKSPTPPWLWAATVAALDAYESDPARPRQTLAIPGVLAPAVADQWTREERNTLLYSGISTFRADLDGTCRVERLITTYRLNAFGVEDTAYLDVETMRTIAYLRFTVRQRITTRYPRHKLANDGTVVSAGQAVVTPNVLRGELLALFREWEAAGLAEDIGQFKRDLVVQRNDSDPNRVDAVIPPNVINQFRVFAGQVQFRL
ncbi:MAG: phage tail sheath subtilisin-like domain-containing protein [Burkholderiales bacterium]|nr:phage tail sheath subtilisin-like domain-containing protein [Burkholderiales bacterium]